MPILKHFKKRFKTPIHARKRGKARNRSALGQEVRKNKRKGKKWLYD